jgi:hypothetical protein
MTMNTSLRIASRLALAVTLAGLTAGAANAAAPFSGEITLPHEVRWGAAVLPAGDYTLAMSSVRGPLRVIDDSGRIRALLYGAQEQPRATQPPSILVTSDGTQWVVRSFNCPAWGMNLVYKPFTRAERSLIAEGDHVLHLPVRMAAR